MEPIGEMHVIKMAKGELKKMVKRCRYERFGAWTGIGYCRPVGYKAFFKTAVSDAQRRESGSMARLIWG